jgi:hypothetical protein
MIEYGEVISPVDCDDGVEASSRPRGDGWGVRNDGADRGINEP